MSSSERSAPPLPPMRSAGGGGPFAGLGLPTRKAKNFRSAARRLLGQLRPESATLLSVAVLAFVAVACSVSGPRLLGQATNLVFSGVVSKSLPAGTTQMAVIAQMRASGQSRRADMLSGMHLVPGQGVDFAALTHLLFWVLALYAVAATLTWAQAWLLSGVVQRTMYGLRQAVETKLHRLPL